MNPIHWDLGDGLVIRTLTPDDDRGLFALVEANRDRLHPWMPWEPRTLGPTETRSFIERAIASETDYEANGIWVDGELVGTIGFRVDVPDEKGEIGYWIDRGSEGRGIVTRASRRFLAFGFDELGLHRIELHAAVENRRSRAVAERLGMVEEGIHRQSERVADGFLDSVVYGLLADEWRRAHDADAGHPPKLV
jgi:ribosomal-protein-serine acetyltransferase